MVRGEQHRHRLCLLGIYSSMKGHKQSVKMNLTGGCFGKGEFLERRKQRLQDRGQGMLFQDDISDTYAETVSLKFSICEDLQLFF